MPLEIAAARACDLLSRTKASKLAATGVRLHRHPHIRASARLRTIPAPGRAWKKPRTLQGGDEDPIALIRQKIERRFQETGLVLQGATQPSYVLWRKEANRWTEVADRANEEPIVGGLRLHVTVDGYLHVVEIRSGEAKQFVSLPAENSLVTLQWFESGSAFYSHADVRTADDDVEALRGYIQRGELEVARVAAPKVMAERFRSKMAAPRIAALGAYFLLRVRDLDRLHDWPDNLTRWKTLLPDGPVIAAWQRLLDDDPDYEEVFGFLMKAVDRGLPVCTEGVRLLKNGLELFASDDERSWDVSAAWSEVDRFGKAMHWDRSETTYFGDAPDQPRLGLVRARSTARCWSVIACTWIPAARSHFGLKPSSRDEHS